MKLRTKTNRRPYLETLEPRQLLSVYADFNGDGFDDLAIGVPDEDSEAGAVHVIYGTASGLSSTASEFWTQDSTFGALQVPDVKEAGDQFGEALAGGDFDGDGFADLAIGVVGEDVGAVVDAGAVNILYGRATGLGMDTHNNKIWHQDVNRVRDAAQIGEDFGRALASGDFNNDGFSDLAVGVPLQNIGAQGGAGAVHIFYGTSLGINPPGNQTFNLDTPSVFGTADTFDRFGFSMSAGDFNGDGRDDLAVGALFGDAGAVVDAGTVNVFYGSASGISVVGNQQWTQDSPLVLDTAESDDQFGRGLATGDIDNDGFDDLAIGVPDEDVGTISNAGGLNVVYGAAAGLTGFGSQFLTQSSISGGLAETNDTWGVAVTIGDFDFDTFADVAVSAPAEDIGSCSQCGTVIVLFGNSADLNIIGAIVITQETVGGDTSESGDFFGNAVAAADFNGDNRADLAIAAPSEDIGTAVDAGRVFVLHGTASSGFTGGQTWDQNSPGITDSAESDDSFGEGLDADAGKSAPGGGYGRNDFAHLITADVDLDTPINKLNKRRLLGGRR